MSKSHAVLKFLRQVHLYIGVFTTPALLFFAITGALQTFSLHEQSRGSSYKPPALLVELGQLHKKQTTVVPIRRPPNSGHEKAPETRIDKNPRIGSDGTSTHPPDQGPDRAPAGPAQPPKGPDSSAPQPAPQKSHLPMKIFFLLVAISLVASTLTGLYLSYKYSRGWMLMTGLLIAGLVVPILLLPF